MQRMTIAAWVLALGTCAVPLHGQLINTVAGSTWLFPASSLPALSAPLGTVSSVAVDARGNVFAADPGNNIVVKISPSGELTVVAGNGVAGFSGDGGPAASASRRGPSGVTLDPAGDLYIADTDNERIRQVSGGTITTVAGNGASGFSGDGGPATSASIYIPSSLAVDSAGNL